MEQLETSAMAAREFAVTIRGAPLQVRERGARAQSKIEFGPNDRILMSGKARSLTAHVVFGVQFCMLANPFHSRF